MPKLPKKYSSVLTAFFMALIMSSLLSLIFSIISFGLTHATLVSFGQRAPLGFLFAFPIATIVMPQVRKLVEKMTA